MELLRAAPANPRWPVLGAGVELGPAGGSPAPDAERRLGAAPADGDGLPAATASKDRLPSGEPRCGLITVECVRLTHSPPGARTEGGPGSCAATGLRAAVGCVPRPREATVRAAPGRLGLTRPGHLSLQSELLCQRQAGLAVHLEARGSPAGERGDDGEGVALAAPPVCLGVLLCLPRGPLGLASVPHAPPSLWVEEVGAQPPAQRWGSQGGSPGAPEAGAPVPTIEPC